MGSKRCANGSPFPTEGPTTENVTGLACRNTNDGDPLIPGSFDIYEEQFRRLTFCVELSWSQSKSWSETAEWQLLQQSGKTSSRSISDYVETITRRLTTRKFKRFFVKAFSASSCQLFGCLNRRVRQKCCWSLRVTVLEGTLLGSWLTVRVWLPKSES